MRGATADDAGAPGNGMMMCEGGAGGDQHGDMMGIRALFADATLHRTVREIPGGVETITESTTPEGASRIREHVEAMHARLRDGRPIHACDALFAEIFAHAKDIEMQIENVPNGVKVRETSREPYVTKLIRAHAQLVSKFIERGMREMHVNHPPPAP